MGERLTLILSLRETCLWCSLLRELAHRPLSTGVAPNQPKRASLTEKKLGVKREIGGARGQNTDAVCITSDAHGICFKID